jgi:hypothetical protein
LRHAYILFENPERKRKLGSSRSCIWEDNIKICFKNYGVCGLDFIWFRIRTISGIL